MALTIFWSKRADKKFDSIIAFLLEEWGEKVTRSFVKKVYEFLDILQEFPEIGTVENKNRNIRGFVIVKQLTLFYKIQGDKIILLNFFDNRMNPRKIKY
ncbi:Plasmid stabilization system protein ParE [Tangfeifania diversioriginum]|uniref:Plasmid stabilization system protein ParE n=1 Tax=Tangfeifania diversioriginum TaxID=1168035 RepID=A0A1M6LCI8_9BACT|nr:type II toxin-antitoxin system RelE/ParE family toxin [Tangfeifania diversioriginum]SHJ68882.1 Plasmid stabilization system protein ParE [Tangfeifania diversioriginum]